ncbi:DUF6093 family protein (plasmid) [Kitasatospora sp. NBC_01246]|uniref:DUF6093 family protein n=1 Tax=Kitasatospora sp. NBC_01246 TaxID=2903570 RepID=UPI002E3330B7|nr:DUF6093 family protein [Kitasatospora sp. NBC_01246]
MLDVSPLANLVQELVMGDTVRVERPGADRVLDERTGQLVDAPRTLVYEGPGAMVGPGSQPIGRVLPTDLLEHVDDPKAGYKLLTPPQAPVPARDDYVTVTAVHQGGDQSLLNRDWRVARTGHGNTMVVVRMTWCDEIQPKTLAAP